MSNSTMVVRTRICELNEGQSCELGGVSYFLTMKDPELKVCHLTEILTKKKLSIGYYDMVHATLEWTRDKFFGFGDAA